jgi:drug/metabolite transporter (DMT)-like permease
MYIILVPILGLFIRKKPPTTAWISVAIAVMGLYLLSGSNMSVINPGDWMMVGCAFWFAVQITLIDRLGLGLDSVRLNFVQSLICAALCAVVMVFTEEITMENILNCWLPLAYAGILSMGVAYTLQIVGQKALEPTQASLLMSMESVFALIFGWLLLQERLSPAELLGCGAIFCAVILSQIPKKSPV